MVVVVQTWLDQVFDVSNWRLTGVAAGATVVVIIIVHPSLQTHLPIFQIDAEQDTQLHGLGYERACEWTDLHE